MKKKPHSRELRRIRRLWLAGAIVAILLVGGAAAEWQWHPSRALHALKPSTSPTPTPLPKAGDVVAVDSTEAFSPSAAVKLAKADYGATTPPISTGVTKYTFHYLSELPTGEIVTVYARAYLPAQPRTNLPIFAFAPGTTGIGDKCAASLEQPKVANWADYDSHMTMYATQGFASVITDYEGMRDSSRIHHYMVGELEGRAVLDSVRALERLPQAQGRLNQNQVFLSGYSQGGHAAFWADKIASQYAPEIKPAGVVGFGPVMSVSETLTDVTHGANINWFGPYVAYSYADYYHVADLGPLLLPHWQDSLAKDVPAHCIDTDIPFWGRNPANVYEPAFLSAVADGTFAQQFPVFSSLLDQNAVGPVSTPSAKRINQGSIDNVVLPAQQQAEFPLLCRASAGPVQLNIYNGATHYDTMVRSLNDTLSWMRSIVKGEKPPSTCPVG